MRIDIEIFFLETLIFEDESGIKTKIPAGVDSDEVDNTPRPQGSPEPIELTDDDEPYVSPFPLKKTRKVVAPPSDVADDTDVEEGIERLRKKAGSVKSHNKVRRPCSLLLFLDS